MPDDHDNDRAAKLPENPAPRLRPRGLMRTMGDAQGREAIQPAGRGPVQRTAQTPIPQLSEQDRKAAARRDEEKLLQANGLEALRRQHEPKLQRRRAEFDQQHEREIQSLQGERQSIEDRRSSGGIRGLWNRRAGRAAQDDERLQELDRQQAQLDARREEYLAPLVTDQRQELADLEEVHRLETEHVEAEIQRDIYGERPREAPGHDDRGNEEQGRER